MMEKEIDLTVVLKLLIKNIKWILICALMLSIGAFLIANYAITPKYKSSVSLYVNNNLSNENSLNINDINASQKLVNTYIVIIKDDEVLNQVVDKLLVLYSKDELSNYVPLVEINGRKTIKTSQIRDMLTMSAVNNTEVLKIEAETNDPEFSATLCNMVAEIAPASLQRIVKAGSVEKIGEPSINTVQSSPNVKKFALIGGVLGIVISMIIIFIKHMFDNTIKDEEDIKENLNVPVLAEIPDFSFFDKNLNRDKKKKRDKEKGREFDNNVCISEKTPFGIVESYKLMRTNILYSVAAKQNKVIVVTSSAPSDGKSTTCANLAISLAQTSAKVVLIDADMRKPTQHKIFKLSNKAGLSNIIVGFSEFKNVINTNVRENLDIITAGVIPPNPAELLSSEIMQSMIKVLKKYYDYIIIDTPPVNVVVDSMEIMNETVGLALVCRQKKSTYEEIKKTLEKTKITNVNFLGVIINYMNHKETNKGKYSYKDYKYLYREE